MRRSEAENGAVSATAANTAAMRAALEAAGIEFIPESENGTGVGVRFRSRPHPYSHFPFPIFDFEMPFGPGRFGVYRKPSDSFNKWWSLTLIQLANPHHEFDSWEDIMPFWYETLNSGSVLEDVLTRALDMVEGPRKPKHPSEISWKFIQPEDVYPEARLIVMHTKIDWKQSPARLDLGKCRSNLELNMNHDTEWHDFNGLEWWRLDQPPA